MYPDIETVKKILLQENYISEADSKAAQAAARDSAEYIDFLLRSEVLSKTLLGQALAEAYRLPFADLIANPVTKENIQKIPKDIAQKKRIVFVKASDTAVAVATDTPKDVKVEDVSPLFPGKKVHLAYTLPEYVEGAFSLYEQPLATRFTQIINAGNRVAPEIVDEIIKDALGFHASDIHIEPQHQDVAVRFRVDGTLREAGRLPRTIYENILNRVKVESGMRIDEHLTAQDGAMQRQTGSTHVDMRVSLIPTIQGEKLVMRVLGAYVQSYSLSDLGLNEKHRSLLELYAAKPFGMILTVGPTGSGKTTTLYALLKLLNKPNVNITTIEDPVEYKMDTVNQIQVREQANMTFARGLRAIVRQDPDIILVGEIRDQETAEISINAALTGHLLLSTFHANDAATAIPRLGDMGVEPFLLASTLNLVVAQRLVRKICSSCRYSLPAKEAISGLPHNAETVAKYFGKNDSVYAGKGCGVCSGSGYNGRSAIYEMIEVTPEMQELMLHDPNTQQITELARKQGSIAMWDDGIEKIKNGITTLTEVLRVVEPPKASNGNQG